MSAFHEVIDLTYDSDMEDISCDDLFPGAVEGSDVYRVERILEVRGRVRGSRLFLVKWFGYPYDECSWKPEQNLCGCEDALASFLLSKQSD